MTEISRYLVFPEGDTQELFRPLQINEVVDINGNPVFTPLPTHKMILYRVTKIVNREERRETTSLYYLEQLSLPELMEMAGL